MFTQNYTIPMKGFEIKVTGEQLSAFAAMYRLSENIQSRISKLLLVDLYIYSQAFNIDPNEVLCEIRDLESGRSDTGTSPARQYLRKPLKGLWHKHFFSARFVAQNLYNAVFKSGGFKKAVKKVQASNKSPIITEKMIKEFLDEITLGALEEREKHNKLTGEWIIFAKHDQKNYYLCLNTHNAGDQEIFERINLYCLRDFPFLSPLFGPVTDPHEL